MGTLGKACGTFGAFVAGSNDLVETLLQSARTYAYTTALPPAVAAAATRAVAAAPARRSPGGARRVLGHVARFRRGAMRPSACALLDSGTPIQPLSCSAAKPRPLAASDALLARGHLDPGDPATDRAGRYARACASRSPPRTRDCRRRSAARGAHFARVQRSGRPRIETARRDPRRADRTSCCCMAGRCTAACGARGSTDLADARAPAPRRSARATAAASWPPGTSAISPGLARAVSSARAAPTPPVLGWSLGGHRWRSSWRRRQHPRTCAR
jgi:hypothetical protein